MDFHVDAAMNQQYAARTQLDVLEVEYTLNTDAYWRVTPEIEFADAYCMEYVGTHTGLDKCQRARIRFGEDWVDTYSTHEKAQGSCHELGHTVGFDDSIPESNLGCMSGGGQGVLSSHEIAHINGMYDPY